MAPKETYNWCARAFASFASFVVLVASSCGGGDASGEPRDE
jgi:hypothetical protein